MVYPVIVDGNRIIDIRLYFQVQRFSCGRHRIGIFAENDGVLLRLYDGYPFFDPVLCVSDGNRRKAFVVGFVRIDRIVERMGYQCPCLDRMQPCRLGGRHFEIDIGADLDGECLPFVGEIHLFSRQDDSVFLSLIDRVRLFDTPVFRTEDDRPLPVVGSGVTRYGKGQSIGLQRTRYDLLYPLFAVCTDLYVEIDVMPYFDGQRASVAVEPAGFFREYEGVFLHLRNGHDLLKRAVLLAFEYNLRTALIVRFVRGDRVIMRMRRYRPRRVLRDPIYCGHLDRIFDIAVHLDLDGFTLVRDDVFIPADYDGRGRPCLIDRNRFRQIAAADDDRSFPA